MATNYLRDRMSRNQMLMPWTPSETMSTGDAASMLQVSTFTVRAMLDEGTIKGYPIRPGVKKSPWRIYRESVEDFIRKRNEEYALTPEDMVETRSARSASQTRDESKETPRRR